MCLMADLAMAFPKSLTFRESFIANSALALTRRVWASVGERPDRAWTSPVRLALCHGVRITGDRVLLAFGFHLGSRSRAIEAGCIIFETQGKEHEGNLSPRTYTHNSSSPCCEVSVPANLQTDCRAIRMPIYDACMRRFWRNADIHYVGPAFPYFRLSDWPSLVLVQEACVEEAVGTPADPPKNAAAEGGGGRQSSKHSQPNHTRGQ
jgi:hypothetical protein